MSLVKQTVDGFKYNYCLINFGIDCCMEKYSCFIN